MDDESKRQIAIVSKLIALTQAGKIKWTPLPLPIGDLIDRDDQRYLSALRTVYLDKKLRIYDVSSRVDEPTVPYLTIGSVKPKYPYWQRTYVLEFVDSYDRSLWHFPDLSVNRDLFMAAKYQASGAPEFFDKILSDDQNA